MKPQFDDPVPQTHDPVYGSEAQELWTRMQTKERYVVYRQVCNRCIYCSELYSKLGLFNSNIVYDKSYAEELAKEESNHNLTNNFVNTISDDPNPPAVRIETNGFGLDVYIDPKEKKFVYVFRYLRSALEFYNYYGFPAYYQGKTAVDAVESEKFFQWEVYAVACREWRKKKWNESVTKPFYYAVDSSADQTLIDELQKVFRVKLLDEESTKIMMQKAEDLIRNMHPKTAATAAAKPSKSSGKRLFGRLGPSRSSSRAAANPDDSQRAAANSDDSQREDPEYDHIGFDRSLFRHTVLTNVERIKVFERKALKEKSTGHETRGFMEPGPTSPFRQPTERLRGWEKLDEDQKRCLVARGFYGEASMWVYYKVVPAVTDVCDINLENIYGVHLEADDGGDFYTVSLKEETTAYMAMTFAQKRVFYNVMYGLKFRFEKKKQCSPYRYMRRYLKQYIKLISDYVPARPSPIPSVPTSRVPSSTIHELPGGSGQAPAHSGSLPQQPSRSVPSPIGSTSQIPSHVPLQILSYPAWQRRNSTYRKLRSIAWYNAADPPHTAGGGGAPGQPQQTTSIAQPTMDGSSRAGTLGLSTRSMPGGGNTQPILPVSSKSSKSSKLSKLSKSSKSSRSDE